MPLERRSLRGLFISIYFSPSLSLSLSPSFSLALSLSVVRTLFIRVCVPRRPSLKVWSVAPVSTWKCYRPQQRALSQQAAVTRCAGSYKNTIYLTRKSGPPKAGQTESEYKCFLLSCCGKRRLNCLEGTVDFLSARTRINKLQARATFGRPPKRCVINGGLRPRA